jgi:hypothetical protein
VQNSQILCRIAAVEAAEIPCHRQAQCQHTEPERDGITRASQVEITDAAEEHVADDQRGRGSCTHLPHFCLFKKRKYFIYEMGHPSFIVHPCKTQAVDARGG